MMSALRGAAELLQICNLQERTLATPIPFSSRTALSSRRTTSSSLAACSTWPARVGKCRERTSQHEESDEKPRHGSRNITTSRGLAVAEAGERHLSVVRTWTVQAGVCGGATPALAGLLAAFLATGVAVRAEPIALRNPEFGGRLTQLDKSTASDFDQDRSLIRT